MKYYFCGIKGSGMSALACILSDLGHEVLGSDVSNNYFTEVNLKEKKIPVLEFNEDNITEDIDCIILGNAFNYEHEEIKKAQEVNIKVERYYNFISNFFEGYETICVAGTNGKTTTTGMLNSMLSPYKPITLIGDGTGIGNPDTKFFILESCEYKETFLNYNPNIAIINNIEMDHPDFFEDIDHVIEVYQKFSDLSDMLVINGDDLNCRRIVHKNCYTFGFGVANYLSMQEVKTTADGFEFKLYVDEVFKGKFTLPFIGEHMIYNSMSCLLVGCLSGIPVQQLIENIKKFEGTKRRFEITVLNEKNGLILIDDYAHHPTAIDLTIKAIRQKYVDYELTVIFQPHTYSRTIEFLDEFAKSLIKADNIYLAEIFASAREKSSDINVNILVDAIKKLNVEVEKDLSFLADKKTKHVIAILGAGDVDKIYIPQVKKIYVVEK